MNEQTQPLLEALFRIRRLCGEYDSSPAFGMSRAITLITAKALTGYEEPECQACGVSCEASRKAKDKNKDEFVILANKKDLQLLLACLSSVPTLYMNDSDRRLNLITSFQELIAGTHKPLEEKEGEQNHNA